MSIQIEEGKAYRARSGEKWVDPKKEGPDGMLIDRAWTLADELGVRYSFRENGTFCVAGGDDMNDLMAEWADEPQHDVKAAIADRAKDIVSGARRSAYGTPEDNFERIARFWQAYFENTGRADTKITAADVSPLMRLMKEARLCETPDHADSHIDLVGYTLTGAEVNGVKASDFS